MINSNLNLLFFSLFLILYSCRRYRCDRKICQRNPPKFSGLRTLLPLRWSPYRHWLYMNIASPFDQEVEKIWKRRFNLSSAIFVAVRYTTLCAVLGNSALNLFPPTHSASLSCIGLWLSASISASIADIFIAAFFVARTWAIWGRHPFPLLVLIPLVLSGIIIDAVFNFAITYGGCILVSNLPIDVQNSDIGSALAITFSFLILCGTLTKTLKLKRAADQAQLKGNLVSLLIRDGMVLATTAFSNGISLTCRFRHILLSRMILDLKSIDQISMASLQYMTSSQFSSIHFIGNIGAPLDILIEDEANISGAAIDTTRSSVKQLLEDPLSIGLLDEQYKISEIILERGPLPSTVVPGTSEV
ncbi:hypothetical protein C8Q75DRAFT_782211 [Abortiporus biennis]|nr:hypothetical protein C8Q75DRAFT_782211 [Abortiporus biennis]